MRVATQPARPIEATAENGSNPPPPKSRSKLRRFSCRRGGEGRVGGRGALVGRTAVGCTVVGRTAVGLALARRCPADTGPSFDSASDRRCCRRVRRATRERRSRWRRRALRRSIFQRLYSPSFSRTMNEVYSVAIEYASPRRTTSSTKRASVPARTDSIAPGATNVRIAFEGMKVYDLEPPTLPNLYHGAFNIDATTRRP